MPDDDYRDVGHDPGADRGGGRRSLAARAASGLITTYQRYISPFLGPRCRFYPTCSAYAGQAISRFGVARGGWLALRRIVRCHPLCDGGVDPVPEQFNWLRRNANERE
jgi:hypothetical protein